ncbi:hypothetical protein ASF45_20760 [Pseudorhodoferax sp. Leaf265]|nr:hypothetical protein ASF45_20760 [Pseudorhodoferax sp. Leaf265]
MLTDGDLCGWTDSHDEVTLAALRDALGADLSEVPEVDPQVLRDYAAWAANWTHDHGMPPTAVQVWMQLNRRLPEDAMEDPMYPF